MTSPRKIQANRANARASTGPRTAPGRARAARNARRHGLSLSVFADPVLSEQVEALAREIAGEPTRDDIYELARRVAEPQIDLQRVRYARHQFLADRLNNRYYKSRASMWEKVAVLRNLLRPRAPEIPVAVLSEYLNRTPQGPKSSQQFCCKRPNGYKHWTVTSGGRYHAESLPFARSIVRALRPTLDKSLYAVAIRYKAIIRGSFLAERSQIHLCVQ